MSDAEAPIRKSDLPIRFAASVVMIVVASAATYFGGWAFRALATLAAVLMMIEWGDMHRVPRLWSGLGALLIAANLLVGTELLYPAGTAQALGEGGDPAEDDQGEYRSGEEAPSPRRPPPSLCLAAGA